jgi:hypothetical protein
METTFWTGGSEFFPTHREKPSTIFVLAERPL